MHSQLCPFKSVALLTWGDPRLDDETGDEGKVRVKVVASVFVGCRGHHRSKNGGGAGRSEVCSVNLFE